MLENLSILFRKKRLKFTPTADKFKIIQAFFPSPWMRGRGGGNTKYNFPCLTAPAPETLSAATTHFCDKINQLFVKNYFQHSNEYSSHFLQIR